MTVAVSTRSVWSIGADALGPAAQKIRNGLISGGTLVAFALIWQWLGVIDAFGHNVLPTFTDTMRALGEVVTTGQFWQNVRHTMVQWAIGLIGAALIAIPVGLFLGRGRLRHRSTRTTIDFLRTIPPVMLLPLFVLVWGTGLQMVVLLAIYAAVWPMLTQTIDGVRQIEQMTLDTATVFKISRRRTFFKVLLPSVAPFITSGVRVSAVISLFIAIVCELVAGSPGLGQALAQAQHGGDSPLMVALILVTGVLGVLINLVFRYGERRLLAWHPTYAKEA
ncbi:ABC transporter permease [Tomitella gaofuii]|uniref:ABC transporter permease n=1 Tax=Tomitella gaofuii TaxID=2760083 RepID=UPI0015FCCAA1|nr:ABC transporter permease [Tomitella gaofuii]